MMYSLQNNSCDAPHSPAAPSVSDTKETAQNAPLQYDSRVGEVGFYNRTENTEKGESVLKRIFFLVFVFGLSVQVRSTRERLGKCKFGPATNHNPKSKPGTPFPGTNCSHDAGSCLCDFGVDLDLASVSCV
jgi:hypothetical protein